MAWNTILPSIKQATREYLIPWMGQELYDDLADKYDAGTELSDNQADVLEVAQRVAAYFTITLLAPELSVGVSDMGLVDKGSNQAPTNPTPQWRYKEFKYDVTKKADKYLDQLLQILDAKVKADDTYFDLWLDSTAYNKSRTVFFANATEFDRFVKIGESRRLFQSLEIDIRVAEENVNHIIGNEQFDLLTELVSGDKGSDLEKELIDKIRRYVSAVAISSCTPRLFLTLDNRGLTLSSYSDGMDQHNHLSTSLRGAEAVSAYVSQMKSNSETYINMLMSFIYENIDSLPLIKNSEEYSAADTASNIVCTGNGGVFLRR